MCSGLSCHRVASIPYPSADLSPRCSTGKMENLEDGSGIQAPTSHMGDLNEIQLPGLLHSFEE